jgi:hypothetical protein
MSIAVVAAFRSSHEAGILSAPEFDSPKLIRWRELAAVAEATNQADKALVKRRKRSGAPGSQTSIPPASQLIAESQPPAFVDTRCAPLRIDQ